MTLQTTNSESEKPNGKPWPSHSSKAGLNKELMEAGITVGFTYIVTPVECDCVDAHEANCQEIM